MDWNSWKRQGRLISLQVSSRLSRITLKHYTRSCLSDQNYSMHSECPERQISQFLSRIYHIGWIPRFGAHQLDHELRIWLDSSLKTQKILQGLQDWAGNLQIIRVRGSPSSLWVKETWIAEVQGIFSYSMSPQNYRACEVSTWYRLTNSSKWWCYEQHLPFISPDHGRQSRLDHIEAAKVVKLHGLLKDADVLVKKPAYSIRNNLGQMMVSSWGIEHRAHLKWLCPRSGTYPWKKGNQGVQREEAVLPTKGWLCRGSVHDIQFIRYWGRQDQNGQKPISHWKALRLCTYSSISMATGSLMNQYRSCISSQLSLIF